MAKPTKREKIVNKLQQSLEEFCGEPHEDLAVGFSRAVLRGEVPPPNWAEDAACRATAEGLLCRVIRLWWCRERRAQLVSALAPFVSDDERLVSAEEAIRFGADECAELIVRAKPFAHLPARGRSGNYIHVSTGNRVSVKLRWLLAEQFPELDRASLWREYLRGQRGGLS